MLFLILITLGFSGAAKAQEAKAQQAECGRGALALTIANVAKKEKAISKTLEVRQNNLNEVTWVFFWTRAIAFASTLLFAVSLAVVASLLIVLLLDKFFRTPNETTRLGAYALSILVFHIYLLGALIGIVSAGKASQEVAKDFKYVSSNLVEVPATPSANLALKVIEQNRQQLISNYHKIDIASSQDGKISLAFGWDQAHMVEFEKTLVESLYRLDKIESQFLAPALNELKAQCAGTNI